MPGSAAEPLIHGRDVDNISNELPENEEGGADEGGLVKPGAFIWGLTLCAGVSGLLFGYDTGVISSTLVTIGTDLSARPLSTLDKSLVTSCTSLFALFASPITGVLADQWGRKRVILLTDILFVLGAVWQAYTGSVWGMVGGRSVVGLAVGSASFVVPLYISELSPSPFRGRLVTVSALFITGGQVVAYIIGWLFSTHLHGWRWMVGLGALPAAVQFIMLQFMPETPRWLVQANQKDLAKKVLLQVYGDEGSVMVPAVLRQIEKEIYEEEGPTGEASGMEHGKGNWKGRWAHVSNQMKQLIAVGGYRRALTIACLLQGFQQLCGFNSLMYFSATIFAMVGFTSPTLTSLSIALTNFLFTIAALHWIDTVGRRRILLLSVPVMVVGLVLCSVAFNFINISPEEASGETLSSNGNGSMVWPVVILCAMVTYVAGYAIGMGNVPWQQSELFPLSVRSVGSGLATSTNWGSNFLVGISFLPMMAKLTPVWTFALYAVICVLGWIAVWRIYPELGGLELEHVGEILKDGWNVEESIRQSHLRKRNAKQRSRQVDA